MLVKVILDGELGKRFGREWELAASSPAHALNLIDANKPGVYAWIRQNLTAYSHYKIVCEYADGRHEEVSEDELVFERKARTIRFIPLVKGASAVGRIIAGVALVALSFVPGLNAALWAGASTMFAGLGASLILGGVAQLLAKTPDVSRENAMERKDKTSYLFDGPVNTTGQGIPVALIYGRVLVGSHTISAGVRVNMLMNG